MVSIIISIVIATIAIMVVISGRQSVKNMKAQLRSAQENMHRLEQRLEASRDDLKKNRNELEREKSALRDARELTKKKLKRQAAAEREETAKDEAAMTDSSLESSQKALYAMEAQLENLRREHAMGEEQMRAQLSQEMAKKDAEKDREIGELTKKISDLQEEIKRQKKLLRPEGHKIDLKALPDEAASEFARVYRKAEQHERLHGIARAKLHLAQEKFTELQKRYFAVCRELALLSGRDTTGATEARDIAEKIIIGEDKPEEPSVVHEEGAGEGAPGKPEQV